MIDMLPRCFSSFAHGNTCRLARVEEATTQVLEAVARLDQRVQQSQGPAPQHSSAGAGNDSADSLQLQDPAALASLLAALERVEQQEKNIQERWFGSSNSSGGDGSCGAQQVGDWLTAQLAILTYPVAQAAAADTCFAALLTCCISSGRELGKPLCHLGFCCS
jgi:hypothetical protein